MVQKFADMDLWRVRIHWLRLKKSLRVIAGLMNLYKWKKY